MLQRVEFIYDRFCIKHISNVFPPHTIKSFARNLLLTKFFFVVVEESQNVKIRPNKFINYVIFF